MSEPFPHESEEQLPFDLAQLGEHIPAEIENIISKTHPVRLHGLQLVANSARLNQMPAENKLLADNLSALTQATKASVASAGVSNPGNYADALQFGGGLAYAAARLQYDGQVPEISDDTLSERRLYASDKSGQGWLNRIYQIANQELRRSPPLRTITDQYRQYLPHPITIIYYEIGVGYVHRLVAEADAHHRLHAALADLAAIEQTHGTDLSKLFNELPDNFRDNPSGE